MDHRSHMRQALAQHQGGLNTLLLVAKDQRRQIRRLWWIVASELVLAVLLYGWIIGRLQAWW